MPSSPFALLRFKGLIFTGLGVTMSLIWKHKKSISKKASLGQATTLEKLPNEVSSEIIIICSSKNATTIEKLPTEVLSDIFTRLSAKELAQMRCVSKSWNALLSDLVSDSSFINSHLSHSLQTNDELLLFSGLMFSLPPAIGPRPCVPFEARHSRSPNVELPNFIELPVIREGRCGLGVVIGSVNGLICFYFTPHDDYDLYIWNPSIHAMLTLPPCLLSSCSPFEFEFGFGYDSVSDDYKILKLTTNMEVECEVYSMKMGSWKLISQRFPSRTIHKDYYNQVYVDGHLHWLCVAESEGNPQMIVGFDLHLETFNEIPLPDVVYKCLNCLGVLGGKLCVISHGRNGNDRKWEVWVMNEYGVAESWVEYPLLSRFTRDVIPYGFTSRGEFLFQVLFYRDRFGLYDPVAKVTKTFRIRANFHTSKVVEYVDSLVWVTPLTSES